MPVLKEKSLLPEKKNVMAAVAGLSSRADGIMHRTCGKVSHLVVQE